MKKVFLLVALAIAMIFTVSSQALADDEHVPIGDYKVSVWARSSMEVIASYLSGIGNFVILFDDAVVLGYDGSQQTVEETAMYQKACAIADIDFDKVIVRAEAKLLRISIREDARSIEMGDGPIYAWSPDIKK